MGGRTDRRTDTSPHTTAVVFSHKLAKTVTMLLLFGHVTLINS